MLLHLTLEKIGLMDHLHLTFGTGLTVITGETGAGKSMLLDGLGLLLGERAEASLIRQGETQGMISSQWLLPPQHPAKVWLNEHSLEQNEEILYIRRILKEGGRSQAFINEIAVPVATLKELGSLLVEMHSQNGHPPLLDATTHVQILDTFAGHRPLAEEVSTLYEQWRTGVKQQQKLQQQADQAAQRRDYLIFQIEELLKAGCQPNELAELEKKRGRLLHTSRLKETTQRHQNIFSDRGGLLVQLRQMATELERESLLDPSLTPMAESIRSILYEGEEIADRLHHYHEALEADPEELTLLDERVNLLNHLSRKHRVPADNLPTLLTEWQNELSSLDQADDQVQALSKKIAVARQQFEEKATRLSQARKKAADHLIHAVTSQLKGLYLSGCRLAVNMRPIEGDPKACGREEIEFLLSANPGEPLKPLRQVASGGELSRILLAMKCILAQSMPNTTMVFDEIDVGVGGKQAAAIGIKLAEVAKNRQILAITHQPQVAAYGLQHLKVEKHSSPGTTTVYITPLTLDDRIEELGRMLAGAEITAKARENASEMLTAAHNKSAI